MWCCVDRAVFGVRLQDAHGEHSDPGGGVGGGGAPRGQTVSRGGQAGESGGLHVRRAQRPARGQAQRRPQCPARARRRPPAPHRTQTQIQGTQHNTTILQVTSKIQTFLARFRHCLQDLARLEISCNIRHFFQDLARFRHCLQDLARFRHCLQDLARFRRFLPTFFQDSDISCIVLQVLGSEM